MFRFRRFSAESGILIITIPTDLHEKLHTWIWENTRDSIVQMGLRRGWNTMGSKTHRAQGHPGGDGGEGDSTDGPKTQRGNQGDWPTLVIEAVDSETLSELKKDMEWWFSTSNHQVKIVLLAKFDHGNNRIYLESGLKNQPHPGKELPRPQHMLVQLFGSCRIVASSSPSFGIPALPTLIPTGFILHRIQSLVELCD